jgi:hypothetical protein
MPKGKQGMTKRGLCKMYNKNKTLDQMAEKLDDLLTWLTDSPMNNKDFNQISKIFLKYMELIEKNKKHNYENEEASK